MKAKIKLGIFTMVFALCLSNQWAYAQWQNPPTSGGAGSHFANTWGGAPDKTHSVGIGDFWGQTPQQYPNAFLHVNSNYLTLPANLTITSSGEVFRTTSNAPPGGFNAWRLFTGAGAGTEKFSIYTVPATPNNVTLQASIGDMLFNSGGPARRMRIAATGNVGVGDYNNFVPQSLLHLHSQPLILNGTATYLQITDAVTGAVTSMDGFKIGTNSGTAELRQQENLDMIFYTTDNTGANVEQMRIAAGTPTQQGNVLVTHNGNVGSGAFKPATVFRVVGNGTFDGPNDILEVAEFRRDATNGQETAIKIRGQRHILTSMSIPPANVASILLSNFDDNEPDPITGILGVDYIMGKIASGMEVQAGQTGNMSFFTNEGIVNGGLKERVRINSAGNVGINMITPGSALEINSYPSNPKPSGLKFHNLNSISGPFDINNGYCLTVDDQGNVILVPGGGSPFFQCGVPNTASELQFDSWIQLNDHNFYFADGPDINSHNNVGIGYNCSTLNAKLDVLQASGAPSTIGIQVLNNDYGISSAPAYGIYSSIIGVNPFSTVGGNVAGFFAAPMTSAGINYSIIVPPNGGWVGIGMLNPTALLSVNGSANCPTSTWDVWSDSLLKTDISPYKDGLSLIKQIKPVSYKYNGLGGLPTNKEHIGIIAEQLALVAPYMVDTIQMILDTVTNIETPILTFSADAFFYMSINAIKELDSTITQMSSAAENGLHIDSIAAGNPVKMGGTINETTTIGLKRNLIFTSDNTYTGQVCIGSPTTASSEALMVNNNTRITSARFMNLKSSATDNVAAGFLATGSSMNNFGGQFTGSGDNAQFNYGAAFTATGKSKANYGVYATATGSGADYAGYFNGNLYASSYLNLPSDSKLKENVQPITNAMSIINQLQPKTFTFKAASFPSINLPAGQQYGLIAQEVSPILPTLVSTTIHPAVYDSTGNMVYDTVQSKSLNYEAFIPILIQGAKEQQSKIDSMATLIQDLQNQMAQVLGNNGGGAKILNTINVELANDAVLYQNIPNPFAEETMINYYIHENTGNAKIIFLDMYGQSMKEVTLTETSSGNIHVDSKNLASGIYSYSLVIDGKVIDTKKMVRNK